MMLCFKLLITAIAFTIAISINAMPLGVRVAFMGRMASNRPDEKLEIPTIDPDWGYVVTDLGKKKNEVAVVFTNHTEKTMTWTAPVDLENVRFLVVGGGGGARYVGIQTVWAIFTIINTIIS